MSAWWGVYFISQRVIKLLSTSRKLCLLNRPYCSAATSSVKVEFNPTLICSRAFVSSRRQPACPKCGPSTASVSRSVTFRTTWHPCSVRCLPCYAKNSFGNRLRSTTRIFKLPEQPCPYLHIQVGILQPRSIDVPSCWCVSAPWIRVHPPSAADWWQLDCRSSCIPVPVRRRIPLSHDRPGVFGCSMGYAKMPAISWGPTVVSPPYGPPTPHSRSKRLFSR